MPIFELKIINDRLVIDLNKMTEDYAESYGYDGLPSKFDIGELACAEVFAKIELTEHRVSKMLAEYENGGECGWCDEVKKVLRGPHLFDFVAGEKMCHECWNLDRGNYLGSLGEDIGPFDENDKSKQCVVCKNFIQEKDQLSHDDGKITYLGCSDIGYDG